MIYLVWFLSLVAAFGLGFWFNKMSQKVQMIQEVLKEKVDKKPVEEEPASQLIDLSDPVAEAMYERDKMMKKLNP